jgi:hypothetical protein
MVKVGNLSNIDKNGARCGFRAHRTVYYSSKCRRTLRAAAALLSLGSRLTSKLTGVPVWISSKRRSADKSVKWK